MKHLIAPLLAVLTMLPPALADNPRFLPVESYCLVREASGMMAGQVSECACEWGYRRYEIHDITMNAGGMTIPNRQHIIYEGPQITTLNPDTNTGTVIQNPMYDAMVTAAQNGDHQAVLESIVQALGGSFTGETREIAGLQCNVATSPMLGNLCISDNGLMLELAMAGGVMNQVATSVELDTCGDMANYQVPADATITEGPDLGTVLQQLQGMQAPAQ